MEHEAPHTVCAFHTDCQVLHPAAAAEFRRLINERASRGDLRDAAFLWASAVEIQHYPPLETDVPRVPELPGLLPPVRQVPCTSIPCARCDCSRGGFQFPYVAVEFNAGVLVKDGRSAAGAWEDFHRCGHRLGIAEVLCLQSGLLVEDILPPNAAKLIKVVQTQTGAGGATPRDLWRAWRSWHGGQRRWRDPCWEPVASREEGRADEMARSGRSLWHWLGAVEAGYSPLFSPCVVKLLSAKTVSPNAGSAHSKSEVAGAALAAALASQMAGIYALQAMEDPSAQGETLGEPEAETYRVRYGLEDDLDFSYAFTSWEKARDAGGHAVADAWAEVCNDREDGAALGFVRQAVDAAAARPAVRAAVVKKLQLGRMARSVKERAGQRASDASVPDSEAANELAQFMEAAGAHEPGDRTERRSADWKNLLSSLAERKVKEAERATVDGCLRSLRELLHFQLLRGRAGGLADVDKIDLFAFLEQGTKAPVRALNGLRWFSKHASLEWELADLQPSRPVQAGKEGPSQAAVAEPIMLSELEARVVDLWQFGDPRWNCLLGNWIIFAGCVRHKHLERSVPISITGSTVHFWCQKGKQAHNRNGFAWAVPSHFMSGWPWAEYWLDSFKGLPPSKQLKCGVCFDAHGNPWAIHEVTKMAQDEFLGVEPPVTTYSWRRVAPSVGLLLQLDEQSMLSLSDWQDRSKVQGSAAAMPLHYAGTKYGLSVRNKHLILATASRCLDFASWDAVSPQLLVQDDPALRNTVAEKVRLDGDTVWQAPASFPGPVRKKAFQTTALHNRRQMRAATAAGGTRSAEAEPTMPAQANGRVLSAFLRNGSRLCPNFQLGRCRDDDCVLQHQCAAVLRSSRVCGGRHAGKDCRDKRRMKPEDVPRPVPPPAKAPTLPAPSAAVRLIPASEVRREEPRSSDRRESPSASSSGVPEPRHPPSAAARKRNAAAMEGLEEVPVKPMPRVPKAEIKVKKAPVGFAAKSRPAQPVRPPPKAMPRAKSGPEAAGAKPKSRPASVRDTDESFFDRLAERSLALGDTREALQIPTTVYQSRAGGRLLLSALPTQDNRANFPVVDLQVTAMEKSAPARKGINLPNALVRQFNVTSSYGRDEAFAELFPLIKHTLWEGRHVLIHCIAGRHRGGSTAVTCRAILMGESLRDAEEHVRALRDIELHKVRWQNRSIAEWMEKAVRRTNLGAAPPVPVAGSDPLSASPSCGRSQLSIPDAHFGQVRSLCMAERAVQRLFQSGRSPMAVSMIG
ncbi:clpC [Symbiodinium natans]|uniref:ClpC protein n=1 Tax=Symbiodinium natans TaxID=878477 RepID=A0A812LC10_9DINO|nr:clpC [Symbiodinium natans]